MKKVIKIWKDGKVIEEEVDVPDETRETEENSETQ